MVARKSNFAGVFLAVPALLLATGCAGPRAYGPDLRAIRAQYAPDQWRLGVGEAPIRGKDASRVARMKAEGDLVRQMRVEVAEQELDIVRQKGLNVEEEFSRVSQTRAAGLVRGAKVVGEGPDTRGGVYRVVLALPRDTAGGQEAAPTNDKTRIGTQEFVRSTPTNARRTTPDRPVTVEAEAEVPWPDDWTVGKARQAALDLARRRAVEQALGVDVEGATAVQNNQIVQDLSRSLARGRILTETVLEDGPAPVRVGAASSPPAVRTYRARIRAEVQPITEGSRAIGLRASLDKPLYTDGEEATLRVEAAQDAYLYIFNVAEDGGVTLLFPNGYEPNNALRALAAFIFPSEPLRAQGVRLRARLPAGRERSAETLKILALKEPLDLRALRTTGPADPVEGAGLAPANPFQSWSGTNSDLMQTLRTRLAATADWADATLPFEVVRGARPHGR